MLIDRPVPLGLVHPARRVLQHSRIAQDVNGGAQSIAAVGATRLLLGAVLQIPDELVVLAQLIRRLARVIEQFGVERCPVQNAACGRGGNRVLLVEVREIAPELVLHDRTAQTQVEVLVARQTVSIRTNRRAHRRDRLIRREVPALDVLRLVVVIQVCRELAATTLADELGNDAWIRHLGRVRRRPDEDFGEGPVIEVEPCGGGAFRRVDALNQRTVLTGIAVPRSTSSACPPCCRRHRRDSA